MLIFFAGDVDKAGHTIGISLTKQGVRTRLVSYYAVRRETHLFDRNWVKKYIATGLLAKKK